MVDVYWMNLVAALRANLAGQRADFIATATMDEIEAAAGVEFAQLGPLAKATVVEMLRRSAPQAVA